MRTGLDSGFIQRSRLGRIVTQLTMVGRVNPAFDHAGTIAGDAGTDDRRWVDRGDCPNSIKLCVLANFHSYADDL
jgi:hypothetical protein